MSMGKRENRQQPLWIAAPELPRSAGHRFYEKLNELLREAGFDRRVEALCQRFYEADGTAGDCGMKRNETGLRRALAEIPELREGFWSDVCVPGSEEGLNQALERAGRVADYF